MKKVFVLNLFFGFITGFICGFFGAGGGLIIVPYMTLCLKKDEIESRATAILCIFCLVLICSFFYFRNASIDWRISTRCSTGGIIGSFIGTKLLNNIEKKWLQISFIVFLIYSGIRIII